VTVTNLLFFYSGLHRQSEIPSEGILNMKEDVGLTMVAKANFETCRRYGPGGRVGST